MTKGVAISVALNVLAMTLLMQHVNAGSMRVHSSASSSSSFLSTDCAGMMCSPGQSCSVSMSATEDSSTQIKSCTGNAGKYHKETIVTTVVGDQRCITNTTDVDGKINTMKNCSRLDPQELKKLHEEWDNKMNMITEEEEKLNSLLESKEHAWEKQQEAQELAWEKQREAQELAWEKQEEEMERAFEDHERTMEQAMLERERFWEMQEEAMHRKLETLADLEI